MPPRSVSVTLTALTQQGSGHVLKLISLTPPPTCLLGGVYRLLRFRVEQSLLINAGSP